jgi:hypothetical protein
MLRPWNPTKEEIERWLKTKELDFAQKDNKNSEVDTTQISGQVRIKRLA